MVHFEIKCLNVWSCLRHKYWVVFGTMYQNHWYFLICGEGYESGSLSGMSIKNNLVSLEEDMTLLFLFFSGYCVQIFSLQRLWDLKWAVQTACGDRPFWVPSPCCKTHLPWCTTQAFWLKNTTFSKLLGRDNFIILSRNSYNFLLFKYSFTSAI